MDLNQALGRAQTCLRLGQFQEVEAICKEILEGRSKHPDALHMLGVVALQAGRYREAIELIDRAVQENRHNATYYINLGECYRMLGELDRATSLYEQALRLDPGRAEAHCNVGSVLQAQGKNGEALASYTRALELNPDLAHAHYNKANLLYEQREFDAAIAAYRRAVQAFPSFADAHFNLGNALSTRGQLTAAADAYGKAIACVPRFANAHYNLGQTYRKLGELDAAIAAYQDALKIDPSIHGAYLHLGTIAKLQGRLDDALGNLRRAIELSPDLAAAHTELAHVLVLLGKTEEAISAYRRAIELEPNLAWSHIGLSSALAKAGRLSEATSESVRAVRLRRVYELPFSGREPLGRVVVLKGVEDSHFLLEPNDELLLLAGSNNADDHFDRNKFQQYDLYIDQLEPGTEASAVPDCDVIFNAISDIDAMPRCHDIAERIARTSMVPVINHPVAVARTCRHLNYQALHDLDGIVFPKTIRVDETPGTKEGAAALLDEYQMTFPVLVRRVGTHTGVSLEKADDIERLWIYFSTQATESYYLTEFSDLASEDGTYCKMRMYVVDGVLYPSQLVISHEWNVRNQAAQKKLMRENDWMLRDAAHFMHEPEDYLGFDAYRAVASIHTRLPLDYLGLDFSRCPDGRIFVFEANPVMRLPYLHTTELDDFSYRRPGIEAIVDALQRLLETRIHQAQAKRT